jgi:hypothetical protein
MRGWGGRQGAIEVSVVVGGECGNKKELGKVPGELRTSDPGSWHADPSKDSLDKTCVLDSTWIKTKQMVLRNKIRHLVVIRITTVASFALSAYYTPRAPARPHAESTLTSAKTNINP